ncbi:MULTISPECIES: DUF4421 family protein [Myroides]|uniref:DUF4421 domain-containing protein n=1 Tax=Myroides albus TaxID=2562892 RepID=A0A6I3LMX1_9FLAO|nr:MULTISPECIES: DUF4421 family protein [Myroides]MTG98836.1 DUF4421 domain-containing protein [Myroides albus]MVX36058.1 DUF4421 domain-containing protein [Myroides sp. LoEW2-1]UVD80467.1 DUF4421 domain-containing protein [Myroides albus]
MKLKYSIISLVALFYWPTFGQVDSLYVGKYQTNYGIKIFGTRDLLSLDYTLEDSDKYSFEPNKPTSIGLGFSWKNSSLSYSYGFPFLRDKAKAKTKARDLKYHYYGKNQVLDIYFQQYKGFSLPISKSNEYNHYDNLKINLYGVLYQHVFNSRKYSVAAAYDNSEKQLKSAGSLLVGAGVFYSTLKNIPSFSDIISDYDKRTISIGPHVGYGYNWVAFRNFLVAGSFTLGINGAIEKNLLTDNTRFIVNPQVMGRFALYYQSDDWVIGVTSILNSLYLNFKDEYQTQLTNNSFRFSITKRFSLKKDPKILQYDLVDIVKKKR